MTTPKGLTLDAKHTYSGWKFCPHTRNRQDIAGPASQERVAHNSAASAIATSTVAQSRVAQET